MSSFPGRAAAHENGAGQRGNYKVRRSTRARDDASGREVTTVHSDSSQFFRLRDRRFYPLVKYQLVRHRAQHGPAMRGIPAELSKRVQVLPHEKDTRDGADRQQSQQY